MKASTARSIETIFWLGVWGMGIYWFAQNVLPVITQAIRQGAQTPTPAPNTTPTPSPTAPSASFGGLDIGKTIAGLEEATSGLFSFLSGVSKKALIDNPPAASDKTSSPSFDSTRSFQRWLTEQARSRSRSSSRNGGGSTADIFGPGGSSKADFFRTGEVIVY